MVSIIADSTTDSTTDSITDSITGSAIAIQTAQPVAVPLLGQSVELLTAWVVQQGQPAYRGKQLHQWIYQKGIRSIDEVTVFPKKNGGLR